MVRKVDVVDLKVGKTPTDRNHFEWTARSKKKLLGGSTLFTFSCKGVNSDVILTGVHIDKNETNIVMDKARFMRKRGDNFYLIADLGTHGVNKLARKRGGYYLYAIKRNKQYPSCWDVKRYFYSYRKAREAGVHQDLQMHNVYWRVMRYCYYGMAIKEANGDDNSS